MLARLFPEASAPNAEVERSLQRWEHAQSVWATLQDTSKLNVFDYDFGFDAEDDHEEKSQ